MPLKIRDIVFGDIDAKSELQKQQIKETSLFFNYFIFVAGVDIEAFRDGTAYVVAGLKGTGKTALLRYIEIEAKEQCDLTHFVLFKSHILEEERRSMSRLADFSLNETGTQSPIEQDFKAVWLWFLHQRIAFALDHSHQHHVFRSDEIIESYIRLLRGSAGRDNWSWTSRVFPRFRRGNVELQTDLDFFRARFEADVEWRSGAASIPIARLVERANELLAMATPTEHQFFLFIDELEAFNLTPEQFSRDCRLIRDLIFAISTLNQFIHENQRPIRIICAVRSEIMNAVIQYGGEISRIVVDFEVKLAWSQQDLLDLVERRIEASEKWILDRKETKDVWLTYFPARVDGTVTRKYIVYNSFFRPRDVVRMLRLAQVRARGRERLAEDDFLQSRMEFSSQTWAETTEELLAINEPAEISFIRRCLSNFRKSFYLAEFARRLQQLAETDRAGRLLLSRRDPVRVLEDLYRVGVVGNVYRVGGRGAAEWRNRWIFRGNDFILEEEQFEVHRSLWNYLSIATR
jgi:hypothetical protein